MNYTLKNQFPKTSADCLEAILKDRGVEDYNSYVHPTSLNELDAHLLDNIENARDMLVRHLENNSKICIVVDCDVDGYTSAAVMWLFIKKQKPFANLTFTLHDGKQHGIEDKVDYLLENNFNLVIVPDAGSYDNVFMVPLVERGMEIICLDHHERPMTSFELFNSPHVVIVNNQLSERYTNKDLSGVGIVYKFCQVLDEYFRSQWAYMYLDLVALGNIADVMFMGTNETRYYIVQGLKNIQNLGFIALLQAQKNSLKEKANFPYFGLTPIDIAYLIAPLINAVIRVGTEAEKETTFLAFIDPEREINGEKACDRMAKLATNVRTRQNRVRDKAVELLENRIRKEGWDENNIIVAQIYPEDEIPNTLTGLIAAALMTEFNRPVMLVREDSKGELKGSQRSNANFDNLPSFKDFLEESGYMTMVSGHANASGCGLKKSDLPALLEYANQKLDADAFQNKSYIVDYIFDASERAVGDIGREVAIHEGYFGNGVDEITCIVKNVPLSSAMIMGQRKDCVKIVYNRVEYIKFKDLDFALEVEEEKQKNVNLYVKFKLSEWMGRMALQGVICDYEIVPRESNADFWGN